MSHYFVLLIRRRYFYVKYKLKFCIYNQIWILCVYAHIHDGWRSALTYMSIELNYHMVHKEEILLIKMHEYCVKGHRKEKIIFFIVLASLALSACFALLVDLIATELNITIKFVLTTSTAFGLLYALFSKVLWKSKWFGKWFKFPNLNGNYDVKALSLKNPTGGEIEWDGRLSIIQTWDKILVTLKTGSSSSESISSNSCIEYIPNVGYRLDYKYHNDPNLAERELHPHDGECTITFTEKICSGNAEYFTKERSSNGTMKLTKEDN